MVEPPPLPAAAPPRPAPPRYVASSWGLPVALGAVLGGGALALLLRDPHVAGSWGVCPSALLGFACPGCGGLRAIAELLHGDLAGAWAYNPLAVIAVPLALTLLIRLIFDAARGREPWSPPAALAVGVGVVLVVFAVARNIPSLALYLGPLAVP